MKKRFFSISLLLVLFISTASINAQKFEQPVLISSAGQSADVKLVKMLAQRQNIDATTVLMAKESDLEGVKTLIIVPGFSSKGLGAAGVSQQEEYERVEAVIKAANAKKIPIVLMHIGGNARRQGQSDAFNTLVADNAKEMIVVKQADEDGFFTQLANKNNIPLTLVEKIVDASGPMAALFN
ncbi:MAG: DUF6305 family protein [Marinilabiliaceae bacterium]|jgi:hypothetical protein|nr:DUF6305 family protein [Marinilabiliaceae bacterium]